MIHKNAAARRLARERRTVQVMVALYCRARHRNSDGLCLECAELARYVEKRLDRCPFATAKPTCLNCPVHCYRPEMRQRIRAVMRFSGPRMLLRHPWLAVRHLLDNRRSPPAAPHHRRDVPCRRDRPL
jgi:hypothetical protein